MSKVILISDSSDDEASAKLEPAANGDDENQVTQGVKIAEETKQTHSLKKCNMKLIKEEHGAVRDAGHVDLFDNFVEKCSNLLQGAPRKDDVIKFLRTKNTQASDEYKSSRPYRKLLQSFLSEIKKGNQDVFIFINDATSVLEKHAVAKTSSPLKNGHTAHSGPAVEVEPVVKKRRIQIATSSERVETQQEDDVHDPEVIKNLEESRTPSTSSNGELKKTDLDDETEKNRKNVRKVRYLEDLLKKFSKEIIRLDSEELSLDDLDKEDSGYLQKEKLKKRFMMIYNEVCKMQNCSTSTGRIMERKIVVKSCRFEEINRKVESFINNPKRDAIKRFPDFPDIYYLVEQANLKNKLGLEGKQLESAAQCIFREVGECMQKRRHDDFVFEFGSSVIDRYKALEDPAESDPALEEKLRNNRKLAKANLDVVNEKFCDIQYGDTVLSKEDKARIKSDHSN